MPETRSGYGKQSGTSTGCAHWADIDATPAGTPFWNYLSGCIEGDPPDLYSTGADLPKSPVTGQPSSTSSTDQASLASILEIVQRIVDIVAGIAGVSSSGSDEAIQSVYDAVRTVNTNLGIAADKIDANLRQAEADLSDQMASGFTTISKQIADTSTQLSQQVADVGNQLDDHLDKIDAEVAGIASDIATEVATAFSTALQPVEDVLQKLVNIEDTRLGEVRDRINDVHLSIDGIKAELHTDLTNQISTLHSDVTSLQTALTAAIGAGSGVIAGAETTSAATIAAALAGLGVDLDAAFATLDTSIAGSGIAGAVKLGEVLGPVLDAAAVVALILPLINTSVAEGMENDLLAILDPIFNAYYDIGGKMADQLGINE